jgi:enolase
VSKISKIVAREILDSRGDPTIEVDVVTSDGYFDRASVPSGASKGQYEALELRDNDPKRYNGMGVLKAIYNVENIIQPKLLNLDPSKQTEIDRTLIYLDNTANKSKLGANATLGVSLASARAGSIAYHYPLYQYLTRLTRPQPEIYHLPVPFMNVINGGIHADYNLDIQEFMIIPIGASSFKEAVRWGSEVFHTIGKLLQEKNISANIGDEGGYTPHFEKNETAIEIIVEAITKSGFTPGKDLFLGIDVASSQFFKEGKYQLKNENLSMDSDEMINYIKNLCEKYPIYSVEDGLADSDWANWTKLTNDLGNQLKIVGDDIFVTNIEKLNRGVENHVGNAIIIKPNQIGTLSETIKTIKLAQESGYSIIISHRSGETEDTFIADLAVGVGSYGLKSGGLCRSERIAKYNQILRIEEALGERAKYGN